LPTKTCIASDDNIWPCFFNRVLKLPLPMPPLLALPLPMRLLPLPLPVHISAQQ
jgi:hypothetical protein